MRKLSGFVGVGLLAWSVLAQAAPASSLSINFIHPENYTDAGYSSSLPGESGRAEVQRDIESHLQKLVEQGLAADATLRVDVLDIDLAGRFEPFTTRAGGDLRIVRNITFPQIKLRYILTRADKVVASAEERLADLNYLTPFNRYSSGDRLRYEKAMLDRWFETTIANH